jgi:hypothetical protein
MEGAHGIWLEGLAEIGRFFARLRRKFQSSLRVPWKKQQLHNTGARLSNRHGKLANRRARWWTTKQPIWSAGRRTSGAAGHLHHHHRGTDGRCAMTEDAGGR